MDPKTLLDRLRAYGADTAGALERFVDDEELYATCIELFLDDENFPALDKCMADARYEDAFCAAHALKGVAGNLGLTPLYQAICTLVESLRTGRTENLSAEHGEVQRLYALTARTARGDAPKETP